MKNNIANIKNILLLDEKSRFFLGKCIIYKVRSKTSKPHPERRFGWLVGFYGISIFIGYLMPN